MVGPPTLWGCCSGIHEWLDAVPHLQGAQTDATVGRGVGTRLTWSWLAGGQTRLREQILYETDSGDVLVRSTNLLPIHPNLLAAHLEMYDKTVFSR